MAAMNKKLLMTVGGMAIGGAGMYVAGTQIDKTDYASQNPDNAYKAKLGGGATAVALGALALMKGYNLLGGILVAGGGAIAAEGYSAHEAYLKSVAPGSASATIQPPGGGTPVTVQLPGSGLPVQVTGLSPLPTAIPASSQSGAALRLGMGQSGAAARLRMPQAGAAARLARY